MLNRYKIEYKEKFSPEFDQYWQELIEFIKEDEDFYYLNSNDNCIIFIANDYDLERLVFDYKNYNGKIYQKILETILLDSGNVG